LTFRAAVQTKIAAAGFTVPIAYPGVTFTPPDKGSWLEVEIFENEPVELTANDAPISARGIIQITACTRNGKGMIELETLANQVLAAFPKGTRFAGAIKAVKAPARRTSITDADKLYLPVDIEYGQ
jgi:hypothetical protein